MEFDVHFKVLLSVFLVAVVMGALVAKTSFCTMGAVSDWVNMGDTGRMRAWLFAIAVAGGGLLVLELLAVVSLPANTMPPYRTAQAAWLRYLLGGFVFGIGMVLASGCPTKSLIRIGGGNMKSVFVVAAISAVAYLMFTTQFFNVAIMSWVGPTVIDLTNYKITGQNADAIVSGLAGTDPMMTRMILSVVVIGGLLWFVLRSADFRGNFDHILGGAAVGLAVLAGWFITGGPAAEDWREAAAFAVERPSRVDVQSFTFITPIGDAGRYLFEPTRLSQLNFGIMGVAGVVLGSFLYSICTGNFRFEWFASGQDFINHVAGGVLMGFGGFLAMGCTIGQGVTGASTLAVGSFLALGAMVLGGAVTMKVQYFMLDERGFWHALREGS